MTNIIRTEPKKPGIHAQKISPEAREVLLNEQFYCFKTTGVKPKLEELANEAIVNFYNYDRLETS